MAVSISMSIAQNSQSVANNTSSVTVTVKASWTNGSWNATGKCTGTIKIDGTSYSFSGIKFNSSGTTTGSQTIMTKTATVSHNDNGTKTLSCSASFVTGVSSGTVTTSASKTLTTIPRKSTLSVANGTLGTAQTLAVTRKSTSFTHTIVAKCGTASTTICTKSSSTSISFTPPLGWSSQNTTGTSVSVTYTITTYNGSTSVGNNVYTKTCSIPSSVKPTCAVSVSDATSYYSTYGAYIKGYSKFKVTVTPTTVYGSAIASYYAAANGSGYTSSSFTTGVLKTSGSLTVSATVTDKRGRTSSYSKQTVTVLDYSPPNISKLIVGRCDVDGTANDQGAYVKVSFAYTITDLNGKNSAGYELLYKRTSESEYTKPANYLKTETVATPDGAVSDLDGEYTVDGEQVEEYVDTEGNVAYCTTIDGVSYKVVPALSFADNSGSWIFAADTGSSYDVLLTVTDALSSTSKATSASTAFTLMHWKASGRGMAIGKISELDDVFDLGMQTRMLGGILHPVLEPLTDLDDVRTPNTYVGANVSTYDYGHCPLTSGTFTLEVVGMGEEGQVKQRLTYCHKTNSRAWERIYYSGGWNYDEETDPTGGWVCVSDFDGQLLWEGSSFMHDAQGITLAEPVSKQRTGIVLVFCRYSNDTVQNYHFSYHFVPKMMVAMHGGCGSVFHMGAVEGDYFASKYLYISDQMIRGNGYNDAVITDAANGITYTNNATVLRYVIGV